MPWEAIFAAAGTSSLAVVITVTVVMLVAGKYIEGIFAGHAKRLESSLNRAEEAYKHLLDTSMAIDTDLREKRDACYKELWQAMDVLPRWPKSEDVTYEKIKTFSETLRTWYFKKGGMYLSEEAKKVYISVQEAIWEDKAFPLKDILSDGRGGSLIDPLYYESLRKRCSALRTELTKDLLSRRAAPVVETNASGS